MRLMGRDISTQNVLAAVSERLLSRGLSGLPDAGEVTPEGIEARIDPLSFYVNALAEHADATRALPIETHRDGLSGRAVVLAKTAFRRVGQIFINEAMARQVVFNGHARDSYAQLSAEVLTLRRRIAQLEQALASKNTVAMELKARAAARLETSGPQRASAAGMADGLTTASNGAAAGEPRAGRHPPAGVAVRPDAEVIPAKAVKTGAKAAAAQMKPPPAVKAGAKTTAFAALKAESKFAPAAAVEAGAATIASGKLPRTGAVKASVASVKPGRKLKR